MHRGGEGPLDDIDWATRRWDTNRAYSESKLYITTVAFAVARLWPKVMSNAVDPGWVPTKMGGRGAPDDLEEGHLTQTWLATSDEPAAKTSGHLWYHRERQSARGLVAGHPLPGPAPGEARRAHGRQTHLNADVDIVIVGGGAAGVGAARRLAGSGLSTLVTGGDLASRRTGLDAGGTRPGSRPGLRMAAFSRSQCLGRDREGHRRTHRTVARGLGRAVPQPGFYAGRAGRGMEGLRSLEPATGAITAGNRLRG